MLNMCNDHRLARSILFKNNALNHLQKILCGRGEIVNGTSNSYTSIICNISPLKGDVEVSYRTLKFATEAAKIKIKPSVNFVPKDYEPDTETTMAIPAMQKRRLNKQRIEDKFRTTDGASFRDSSKIKQF